MKPIIFILFSTIILTSFNGYGQINIGLKADYTFGGNANDVSGQNNNGVVIGSLNLTTDRFGSSNCAYYFPGDTSNYIKVNYSTDFDISPTGAFSISLWYQGGTSDMSDFESLFRKENIANDYFHSDYHMALYDNNSPCLGSLYPDIVIALNPTATYPDTNWHHIVGIYDNTKWSIYEDNILKHSTTTQTVYTISQSAGDIVIGKKFQGKIDDIRFYNRAITTNEINQLYTLSGSCQPTGISENIEQEKIKIFPNPIKNIIQITGTNTNEIKDISIYNIHGQEIIKQKSDRLDTIIDLSHFENGVYLIRITIKGSVQQSVFIKE